MHYINPIEILELNGRDAISIDNSEIKKAKKRLIADIELSEDGHFNYKGQSITKSDCERAILDLENDEKKEFKLKICKMSYSGTSMHHLFRAPHAFGAE